MAMTDCIIPQRKVGWQGYMQMFFQGKYQSPHRVAWKILNGEIADGIVIDHECHNEALRNGECEGGNSCKHRSCVNPAHLRAITLAENTKAGARPLANNGFCKRQHPVADNLRYRTDGRGYCHACRQEDNKNSILRAKARSV